MTYDTCSDYICPLKQTFANFQQKKKYAATDEIDSLVLILAIEHSAWEYFSYWWLSDQIFICILFRISNDRAIETN